MSFQGSSDEVPVTCGVEVDGSTHSLGPGGPGAAPQAEEGQLFSLSG